MRGVLGAVLMAAVALTGPAEAHAARSCEPGSAPREPSRIEQFMAQRAMFGFRSDRAYVKRLIRRGVWEYDIGYIPVTPRENRYLRLRDRLVLGRRADQFLHHHPDLSGGVSIEDAWPREPYLLVRVTHDPTHYRRVLRRRARFPRNVRTKRVARSYRALRRVQDQISFSAHEADGFHVTGAGVDIDGNQVEVELITRRADAQAYFRARYGRAVFTRVIATELTSAGCADLFGYTGGADDTTLTISYESGGGIEYDHAEVVEYPDRVEVAIAVRKPNGPSTSESITAEQVVQLAAPRGSRKVIDTVNGKPLAVGRRPPLDLTQ
jgi:hypothetical protein